MLYPILGILAVYVIAVIETRQKKFKITTNKNDKSNN